MQYKVPQNIDMADRIVGPLTLVQFLYLLVGGIIVYALFNTIAPVNTPLFLALGIPISIVTLAFAFLKIQDQPFPKFVVALIVYIFRPKSRIWFKAGVEPQIITEPTVAPKSDTVEHKTIKKSQLEQLTQVLDTGTPTARIHPQQTSVPAPNLLKNSRPHLDSMKRKK